MPFSMADAHIFLCLVILARCDFMKRTFFFFNDPATTEIYPLPLPDALPICRAAGPIRHLAQGPAGAIRAIVRRGALQNCLFRRRTVSSPPKIDQLPGRPGERFEPYVHLVRCLMPRTSCVAMFGPAGELAWSSESMLGPDLDL